MTYPAIRGFPLTLFSWSSVFGGASDFSEKEKNIRAGEVMRKPQNPGCKDNTVNNFNLHLIK